MQAVFLWALVLRMFDTTGPSGRRREGKEQCARRLGYRQRRKRRVFQQDVQCRKSCDRIAIPPYCCESICLSS